MFENSPKSSKINDKRSTIVYAQEKKFDKDAICPKNVISLLPRKNGRQRNEEHFSGQIFPVLYKTYFPNEEQISGLWN